MRRMVEKSSTTRNFILGSLMSYSGSGIQSFFSSSGRSVSASTSASNFAT